MPNHLYNSILPTTPSFGHGITFGRVAYIAGVGPELLDLIEKSGLSITMTGDGLVATTMEALTEHVFMRGPEWMVRASLDAKFKLCEEFLDDMRVRIIEANRSSADPRNADWDEAGRPPSEDADGIPIGEIIFSA